ncbi:MAG: hypothetical protein C0458_04325 [Methylobacterium sp.]|nr:hypothetical protein [Methylobacterium sp.]
MTPAAAIAALDRQLSAHGATVTLRRRIGESEAFVDLVMRARIKPGRPMQLTGGIVQVRSEFILSPTPITAAGASWPGAAGGVVWPATGDFLVVQARERRIEHADPFAFGGDVVRIDGMIEG